LLNQLDSEILLRLPFVMGRGKAGFDCPDIWDSSILVWQLQEIMLAEIFLDKLLVDTGVKKLPKKLLNIGEFPLPP
jgi:hypothetical protein